MSNEAALQIFSPERVILQQEDSLCRSEKWAQISTLETSIAEQYPKIDQLKACDCLKTVSFRNEEAILTILPCLWFVSLQK